MNIKPTGKKKNMNITKLKSINKSKHRKTIQRIFQLPSLESLSVWFNADLTGYVLEFNKLQKPHLNQTIQRIETQQSTQLIHSQTKP